MDLSTLTEGQRRCVTTLDVPQVVSAGAGSGKTFTLTRRIAWAFEKGSGEGGEPFLDDIGQVLAITFTEKAAGEIKSRVKSTLRSEGLLDQAMKVDDAWISTIHGMCSRILRTHATELGLDPAFVVLDEAHSKAMLDAAIEEAFASANEFVAPEGLDSLFAEYSVRSSSFGGASIEDMVRTLAKHAASSAQGCASLVAPPPARDAGELVRAMVELTSELLAYAGEQNPGSTRDAWMDSAAHFIEQATCGLESGDMDAHRALRLMDECPFPSAGFGTKDYRARVKEHYQPECANLAFEVRLAAAEPFVEGLFTLARKVCDLYAVAKREACALDLDDLLIVCHAALCDNPRIAAEYAGRFKLVMLDESQDTDQLQMDMISMLAGDGARLCAVGDAQQSIYRFRGADVSVYERHLARVRAADASMPIELPDNFRSHGDVLRLVDRIFEQPDVFGARFMSLAASRDEARVSCALRGDARRVDVLLTTYNAREGANSASAVRVEARRIAECFSKRRAAGHAAGEMVLLLGRMTNAAVYAEALRQAGFSCVITGGSMFGSAVEVRVMQRFAETIANPRATQATFELLSSDMFALSADDFIELSTRFDKERRLDCRRTLDAGLRHAEEELAASGRLTPSLAQAVRVVCDAIEAAGRVPTSRIMADAVRDSGWLSRLEAQGAEGLAKAGNIFKAIRLAEDIERKGATGPASVAHEMAAHIEIAKEPPGALSVEGGDFVRIMTVHASKGLEFPIVAVADMELGSGRAQKLACETIEGVTYVSLDLGYSVSHIISTNALAKCTNKQYRPDVGDADPTPQDVAEAASPFERRELLRAYAASQELQERRRLLYVALTRAKEALVVSMRSSRGAKGASGVSSGIYDDIRRALFGEDDIPSGVTHVDFGGAERAMVHRIDLDADSVADLDASQDECDKSASEELVDIYAPFSRTSYANAPRRSVREGVVSYSALASEMPAPPRVPQAAFGAASPEVFDGDADDAFWSNLSARLASDADAATDVGTAFHRLAQCSALAATAAGSPAPLAMPSSQRIEAIAHSCGLHATGRARLISALQRWLQSDCARSVAAHAILRAEVPFFVEFPVCGSQPVQAAGVDNAAGAGANATTAAAEVAYLEGSIDLLACDCMGEGAAFIVDYKTGGSPDETPEALRAKHLLQASCYAYAALQQGFDEVKATFVRVEQPDAGAPDQPQCVRYAFSRADAPGLLARIQAAYATYASREGEAS